MELKSYQKKVIADLTRYLELLNETKSDAAAFRLFWQEKSAPALGRYQNVIPGVPNLCFKVPTGGGKTFIACNAVRPIFDALPATKTKAVVWLVPSDAILTQTAKALKDTSHPYRQKIDVDFGGRVEVYTKQELLNGQNFNPTTVTEQLSVMVLSYDSFRGRGKEVLKAYQENSNLAAFAKVLGKPDSPIEKADETALFQIINQLILPLFCVCWMRKRGYLRSVPARATNRRDSSSPSREANRKVLLRSPTRICLTRFALSPARTGFPASVTGCAGSGLPMQKPCALTSMRAFRRTFVLLRRAMMRNNP